MGCPVLLPAGLWLCTGILVQQALPAHNSPGHVKLTHTVAESHVRLGAHGIWGDTGADPAAQCQGGHPCRAEVLKEAGMLRAPQPCWRPTAVPHAQSTLVLPASSGLVLAAGCAPGWMASWSLAVARLAPASAALLVAFLLQSLSGHAGAAWSPAAPSYSPCLSLESFAIVPPFRHAA